MNNILLIEDDQSLGTSLTAYLRSIDYNMIWARSGTEAFRLFNEGNVDLCLVDIGLPGKSGFEVVKDIKQVDRNVPIIFLTARDQINDKITAFQLGADDYICKPFLIKELELRIQAVEKRFAPQAVTGAASKHMIRLGLYEFNFIVRTLSINGKRYKLSHIDCEILKLLCNNINTFVTTEIMLKAIWDDTLETANRRLSVYLVRLRRYLKEDPRIKIMNVYGSGYKLYLDPAAS